MTAERRVHRHLAFILALLAPPLLVAALGFSVNPAADVTEGSTREILGMILMLSAAAGGPSYLIVGAPLFYRAATRGERRPLGFALQGLLANFIAAPIAIALLALFTAVDAGRVTQARDGALLGLIIHGAGVVFAPVYGFIFGLIFRRLAPPPRLRAPVSEKQALAIFE